MTLWDSPPRITIEQPGSPGDFQALPEKLIASLFYIRLLSPPELGSARSSCLVEVKCRLPPGPHVNSIARELLERRSQLTCSAWGSRTTTTFCDAPVWHRVREGGELSQRIEIKVISLDTEILLQIENENVSNCPCQLRDLLCYGGAYDGVEIQSPSVASFPGGGTVVDEPAYVTIALDDGPLKPKVTSVASYGTEHRFTD